MIFLAAVRSILSELVVFDAAAVIRAPEDVAGGALVAMLDAITVEADAALFLVPVDTTEKVYFFPCVNPVMFA